MESGKVYKFTLQPMTTSNYFDAGHRIRIEVSSSNFPRFDRNMNTGGKNYDETKGVVAHNAVHHSRQYPSADAHGGAEAAPLNLDRHPSRALSARGFPHTNDCLRRQTREVIRRTILGRGLPR